jgi:drug/metabolite transporter (DMT)-like permease
MATLAGIGAIAIWSLLAVLSRGAASIPPLQLTAMSFAVSAVLGAVVLAGRGNLAALRQKPIAWLHGVGGLFGYHACYFAALATAPAAEANLINYTWPLLIVVFSAPILGLPLSRWHLLGVLTGLAGCLLLLARNADFSAGALFGYSCAFAAAIIWALYSVLSRRLASVPTGAVVGFCGASAILAAVAHFLFEPTVIPDAQALASVLLLGIGPVGGAFFLWDIGMKRGDPRLLGTLAYATPVASTIILGLAGFTSLTMTVLLAAFLVVAGGLIVRFAPAVR